MPASYLRQLLDELHEQRRSTQYLLQETPRDSAEYLRHAESLRETYAQIAFWESIEKSQEQMTVQTAPAGRPNGNSGVEEWQRFILYRIENLEHSVNRITILLYLVIVLMAVLATVFFIGLNSG